MTPAITIEESAIPTLAVELSGRLLRIAFTTGCGGSGYRLASAEAPQDGDVVIDAGGIRIALDDMAARSLDGATIIHDEVDGGWVVDHPAAATCVWCG